MHSNLRRRLGSFCALLMMLPSLSSTAQVQHVAGSAVMWGRNESDPAAVPPGLTNVISVAIGISHGLVLSSDGLVVGWGTDGQGEINIPLGLTNVVAIAAGQSLSLALKSDGTVTGWGGTSVPAGLTNVSAIAANALNCLALKSDGTVVEWGQGWNGINFLTLTPPAGLTNIVAIAAGQAHSVALRSDGLVVPWGDNTYAQTNLPSTLTNAVAVAANQYKSLALNADGTLTAWGQTGLPPNESNAVAIASGSFHDLALRGDGTIVGWGSNSYGVIDIPLGLSNSLAIAAGAFDSGAISNQGNLCFAARQSLQRSAYSGSTFYLKSAISSFPISSYQWQLNGTNLSGATSALLALTNVQTTNSGAYLVMVSNIYGSVISSNVNLTVVNSPPFFTGQSPDQILIPGTNTMLFVNTGGSLPITYQWQFNGSNVVGATNSVLYFPNVQLASRGYYDVIATNSYGTATNSNIFLHVLNVAEALDATNLPWTTGGDEPWFVQSAVTEDGFAALQSGTISANQQSTLQTIFTGPGTLTFWWNVSSEPDTDYLDFSVNGVEQYRISGVTIFGFYGWQQQTNYLGAGSQTLEWTYVKTDSDTSISGRDSGWLDQVSIIPGGSASFLAVNPTSQAVLLGSNVTLNATALGTPQLNYQWRFNLTNIDGATSTSLTITNAQYSAQGSYDLVVSNAYGVTNSTPAFLNIVGVPEALNATNLNWSSAGNLPWFAETATTHDGVAALQSGFISGNQQSTIETTVAGPGTLSFWWMVSSEVTNDYVGFALDGTEQARISGATNWQLKTYYLTPGTHVLSWTYAKNATINGGSDAAWLDQVSYVAGGTGAFITNNPTDQATILGSSATFTALAAGTPLLSYQWLLNGNIVTNGTNASLTITNTRIPDSGVYQVAVTNGYGGMVSSNANLFLQNVVAWGAGTTNSGVSNNFGQSLVPTNLARAVTIASGGFHSQAMLTSGKVIDWGDDQSGETNVPVLTNAMAISSGLFHSLALKSNGTAVAWGQNNNGQTSVPSSATNIMAIASGWYHNLALRSNGTVLAWGAGTIQASSPNYGQSIVPTNLTSVIAVAAGGYHSLALQSNGTVVAWGWNAAGQTNVPAGLSNVVAIAAGGSNSIALKNDGTLVLWGDNTYGQTNIPPGLSNVVAISAGAGHNLALKSDGTLVAWGLNTNGQTNIPIGLTNVAVISSGGYHNLAVINVGPITFLGFPYNQTIFKGANASFLPAFLGAAPLSSQWLKNGTNVASATNASLIITNAQFIDAGNYQLVISNSFGSATSAVAVLTVNDTVPFFVVQPTNQSILQNSNATFFANVGGVPPFTYQWLLNGINIAGATNSTLTVTNAQATNAGNYSLVANNAYGTNASSNATLIVIDLGFALNATNLAWTTGGTSNWFPELITTHDGVAAAQSGVVGNGQNSTLQAVVTGPGTLTFWWNISSFGFLSFSINGTTVTSINSISGWQQPNAFFLGAGTQTVVWKYSGGFFSEGSNAAWLDQINFTPGGTGATITSSPTNRFVLHGINVSFVVGTFGTPPLTYQWQLNSNNLTGLTNASFTLTNVQYTNSGIYSVIVSNGYGVAISSNASLLVQGSQFALPNTLNLSGAGIGLQLNGLTGHGIVTIYSSTNLLNWQPIFTNPPLIGSLQFLDSNSINVPFQYYRATEQ